MSSQEHNIAVNTADGLSDADFVAAYLEEHPEFFRQHPQVLEKLRLPHSSGAAVSLVEKQLTVLRERNTELRARLNTLLDTSKANDGLFNKSRTLVLDLIKSNSAERIFRVLSESLHDDFGIEFYSLILLDQERSAPGVCTISAAVLGETLPAISTSRQPLCGVFRPAEMELLFGENATDVGSAVAIPLATKTFYGILALGSSDPHRYHSGMDTLFLQFITDVVNVVLPSKLALDVGGLMLDV